MNKIYPLADTVITDIEKSALTLNKTSGTCPICEKYVVFSNWTENFRESGICEECGSTNRQRQVGVGIGKVYDQSITELINSTTLSIYNTEAKGPIHEKLKAHKDYTCSEYYGPQFASGELVDGIRNEDAQNLSFEDDSIDLILSTDVWEHIPNPYLAHKEVYRVLKKDGRHIFTVPFHKGGFLDDIRAELKPDNSIYHFSEPIYHHDPIRPEGVLVYTIFSIEMLCKLSAIGFHTNMYKLYSPEQGILGNNGLLFEAIKV
ncbi:class I SAM-dependent methyltransferase [Pelagicoccus sp. SDUM812003]|uniref:class I SAM-dependent methyltransferase n=1 Tax=Pelagicoccus sp. SDUM812003 TaxID=3041267 RepID=UPI002810215B|nr:class I SAM-dependent methyltransferase [Pelagicoccus sp. SDUM812003]MDQ8204251.1 class I SAM-dependent methyltransferase [Pelagicoccus sp. SDUM812003]